MLSNFIHKLLLDQGLSQAAPLRQSHTVIEIVPKKKTGQGDNLSPSKFREKTRMEVYMKRFSSVQKLQAKTERGKCILLHVVRQVTFQSSSTKHVYKSHPQPSMVNAPGNL